MFAKYLKRGFTTFLVAALFLSYLAFLDVQGAVKIGDAPLPIPSFVGRATATPKKQFNPSPARISSFSVMQLERHRNNLIAARRQTQIAKVANFFKNYGSPLQGYESIFVDKSEECGGDYRVLVGIAGSESGLGRVNYKTYNPFGYLDGVQYPDQKTALEVLSCKISQQHISKCGTDLNCLGLRYAGPSDDLQLFINKVAWFMMQVS